MQQESGIEIQQALESDIPVIQQIVQITWPATYLSIVGSEQLDYMLQLFYTKDALLNQMNHGHRFILAKHDDAIPAFASYNQINEDTWKLQKLYALPETQGKGIGRLLIDYIINELRNKNAQWLILNVNRYNSAKSFYEKLGFEVTGVEDVDIGNGYFMNDYVLRKGI